MQCFHLSLWLSELPNDNRFDESEKIIFTSLPMQRTTNASNMF